MLSCRGSQDSRSRKLAGDTVSKLKKQIMSRKPRPNSSYPLTSWRFLPPVIPSLLKHHQLGSRFRLACGMTGETSHSKHNTQVSRGFTSGSSLGSPQLIAERTPVCWSQLIPTTSLTADTEDMIYMLKALIDPTVIMLSHFISDWSFHSTCSVRIKSEVGLER